MSVKNRRYIAIVALVVCLLVGMSAVIRRGHERTIYRGQSLQAWCMQAYQGDSNAVVALRELGTNAIPELIVLLKTKDSFLRKQAWALLPRLPLRLRQNIARKFAPPQAEAVREAAARALGRFGPEAKIAIPELSRALHDNQGRVRWEAATALGLIGKDSVKALIKAMDGSDAKARHATAYALGQIGPDAIDAVPALTKSLNDPDQAVRNSAAYSLSVVGTPGFLALIDSVELGQEPGRTVAASMLTNSYLPHWKACSEFLRMTRDESPAIRRRGIEALGAIRVGGGMAVVASLEALKDPAMEVRLTAIKTLGTRGGNEPTASQALTECLKEDSIQIREAAERALQNRSVRRTN